MIKPKLQQLFSANIVRNLSILVSGTVLAQLVLVGFQVVLRRLFSPADFGAFAVYMSLVGILATLSSFRYEQAIVLPKSDQKAYHLLWLSIVLSLVTSMLVALFVIVFKKASIQISGIPVTHHQWLYYLPVSVLLFSVYQALNYYLIRLKMFRQSASNKVERRLFEGAFQTLSGKFQWATGLVLGDMVGQTANVLFATFKLKSFFKTVSCTWGQLKSVGEEYRHFPLQNGLPSLLNAFSLLLPVVFVNRFFDAQVTGLFDLARLVLVLPLSLVTASLSQVMLQQFSEHRNNHLSVKKPLLKIALALAGTAILFALLVTILAPWMLGMVFGTEWTESGHYAQILVWAFALKFIVSPFNILFTVFEKLRWLAWWQYAYFGLILLLLVVPHQHIHTFLMFYTAFEVISSLLAAVFCLNLVRQYEQNRLKHA